MGMPPPVEGATIVKGLLVYALLVVLAVLFADLYGVVHNQFSLGHSTPLAMTR